MVCLAFAGFASLDMTSLNSSSAAGVLDRRLGIVWQKVDLQFLGCFFEANTRKRQSISNCLFHLPLASVLIHGAGRIFLRASPGAASHLSFIAITLTEHMGALVALAIIILRTL